jgi:acetyl esterase/lipase
VIARSASRALLAALVLLPATGCVSAATEVVYRLGMPFLYREAELDPELVDLDLPYLAGGDGEVTDKHRLDFFHPASTARGWPVLVFVHGGGWTHGDRAERPGGYDVYRNIGRFFAARGVGVALLSYRLQPEVSWREQVEDVRAAVRWVHAHASMLGADPTAIFLAGHSAGAHLATYVALEQDEIAPARICGLIPVSGAALDLADERTWELGASRDYYERRFRNGEAGDAWLRESSPVRFASPASPPALVVYAQGEGPELQRQSQRLHEALRDAGAESRLLEVPGEGHQRIVLTLSREDKPAAAEILAFIRRRDCGAS